MDRRNSEARNLLQQEPGRVCRHARATGIPNLSQPKAARQKPATAFRVEPSTGDPFTIVVSGRVRWALDRLREAGERGCTPISEPAARWSAYVYSLRELGVEVETLHEAHGGPFPGHHARYVLHSTVTPLAEGGTA